MQEQLKKKNTCENDFSTNDGVTEDEKTTHLRLSAKSTSWSGLSRRYYNAMTSKLSNHTFRERVLGTFIIAILPFTTYSAFTGATSLNGFEFAILGVLCMVFGYNASNLKQNTSFENIHVGFLMVVSITLLFFAPVLLSLFMIFTCSVYLLMVWKEGIPEVE